MARGLTWADARAHDGRSAGTCFLFTALFYEILDVRQKRASSFAPLVLGMNSIAAPTNAFKKPLVAALLRHFTRAPDQIVGPTFEATLLGATSLALTWLVLWWMHRRKVFLRL